MPNRIQQTISGEVSLSGVGLHTGVKCDLTIKPAAENTGIIFQRLDLDQSPTIPAKINYVNSTKRGTTLEYDGVIVHTVEHVLAAFYGLKIDNAIIEISAPELPIMDGSALPFIDAINTVGITAQKNTIDYYKITEPIHYRDPNRNIELSVLPSDRTKVTFFMDYGLPKFNLQYTSIENIEDQFIKEIAPARTFGLLSELVELKQNGLILGGSLDNAIVIVDKKINVEEEQRLRKLFTIEKGFSFKDNEILNTDGLRFKNEPVRHKVLDLMGDLMLLGKPLKGHIIAERSGHQANIKIVKLIKEKIKYDSR